MDDSSKAYLTDLKPWLGALAVAAGLVGAWVYLDGRIDRELRQLPDPDRHALYQRTLETLRTSCIRADGPMLSDYCCEQAEFVERFPECDEACRTLARRFAPKPTHGLR